jgi:hypothetical protein
MFYSTYFIVLIFFALVAIGGYESTMRLIQYVDLEFRLMIIQIRMYFMQRKLKKQLKQFHQKYGDKNVRNKDLL